jgi:hypothetical protein
VQHHHQHRHHRAGHCHVRAHTAGVFRRVYACSCALRVGNISTRIHKVAADERPSESKSITWTAVPARVSCTRSVLRPSTTGVWSIYRRFRASAAATWTRWIDHNSRKRCIHRTCAWERRCVSLCRDTDSLCRRSGGVRGLCSHGSCAQHWLGCVDRTVWLLSRDA